MLIRSIKLQNLLSFGLDAQKLELKPLNVLIGPNGSGKSNLIEAVSLLQAAPQDLAATIREGGGVHDWIWQGDPGTPSAQVEVILDYLGGRQSLRHCFGFTEREQRFVLTDEQIENEEPHLDHHGKPYIYFELHDSRAVLNYKDGGQRQLRPEDLDPQQSVLAQRKDPDHYPELTWLGGMYRRIRLYREWSFGRQTPVRRPQMADLPNDFLMEDGQNLGLVLNRLMREFDVKQRFLSALRNIYEGVSDCHMNIESGTVQVFLQEGKVTMPATRLSDGTIRYLCLLAILCHPTPPPVICLEEPELGLHPDILPDLGTLLREASERCQLIVTTHSATLVNALTETPESVVVCEKDRGQTTLRRLKQDDLAHWLERYRLGELWSSGELGGNRW